MLKGEDVVLLSKLSDGGSDWTQRSLAADIGLSLTVVHRALKRLGGAGLWNTSRRRVELAQAEEFLVHGVRYFFPAKLEGETRGVPTAWAAEPLVARLAATAGDLPPIWPEARGQVRGLALAPLHPAVPEAARRDPSLGERLALVDALRLGDARVRGLAAELLSERLGSATA